VIIAKERQTTQNKNTEEGLANVNKEISYENLTQFTINNTHTYKQRYN